MGQDTSVRNLAFRKAEAAGSLDRDPASVHTTHGTRGWGARSPSRLATAVAVLCIVLLSLPGGADEAAAQTRHTEHTLLPEAGAGPPSARIEDFAFLEGHWTGEGMGGEAEELWSRPAAGTMVGAFRLIREGGVVFYELFALEEDEGSVVLRLKHFDPGPGLPGWEERDQDFSFPLVRVTPRAAWFGGLTFHLSHPDTLMVYLAIRSGEGVLREERFQLRRVPP